MGAICTYVVRQAFSSLSSYLDGFFEIWCCGFGGCYVFFVEERGYFFAAVRDVAPVCFGRCPSQGFFFGLRTGEELRGGCECVGDCGEGDGVVLHGEVLAWLEEGFNEGHCFKCLS